MHSDLSLHAKLRKSKPVKSFPAGNVHATWNVLFQVGLHHPKGIKHTAKKARIRPPNIVGNAQRTPFTS